MNGHCDHEKHHSALGSWRRPSPSDVRDRNSQGFFVSLGGTDSPSKHFRSLKASSLLCRTPSPSHSRCLSSSLSVPREESDATRL